MQPARALALRDFSLVGHSPTPKLLGCCCLVVAQSLTNMLVYLNDRSAQTIVRAATLR